MLRHSEGVCCGINHVSLLKNKTKLVQKPLHQIYQTRNGDIFCLENGCLFLNQFCQGILINNPICIKLLNIYFTLPMSIYDYGEYQ
ncbi:hypothetical protein FKM82_012217 [Ascaphus truei]